MPKRKAMGKDPLEWIGKEDPFQIHSDFEKPSSLNQEPFGDEHSYPELEKPLVVDESRIEVPTSGFEELEMGTSLLPDPAAPSNSMLPIQTETVRSALERDLLLYEDLRAPREARAPSTTHLTVLIAVLIVSLAGTGIYLFHRSEQGWNSQLHHLNSALVQLESERETSQDWMKNWMKSQNDLLEQRTETIDALQKENVHLKRTQSQDRSHQEKIHQKLDTLSMKWEEKLTALEKSIADLQSAPQNKLPSELDDALSPTALTPKAEATDKNSLTPQTKDLPRPIVSKPEKAVLNRSLVGPPNPK